MYVKQSQPSNRYGMKVPENYSGSAFLKQPSYNEMPPPVRTQSSRHDTQIYAIPHNRDIPDEDYRKDPVPPIYQEPHQEEDHNIEECDIPQITETPQISAAPSIFSSLLPKMGLSNHFPFGHGIGSEELLILAVMLMVFLSGNEKGETDSEFILLLGLLLFAG